MTDPYTAATELLLGDRPDRADVERAGQLLQQASAAGHAEASERCAMMEAFGMARPQSWPLALDFLALAAAQGSQPAQEQLLLLHDNSRDPEISSTADDQWWSDIRAGIDLTARLAPAPKRVLSEMPRIRVIEGFASPAECRWMIKMSRDRLAPATVFDKATGGQTVNAARDNSYLLLRIGEMNVLTEVLRNRIAAATNLPAPLFEPSQLLHYAVGQKFRKHYDFLDASNPAYREELARFGQRIATFLIYLNDDYTGGETSFPAIGLDYRARTGDGLFFANVTRDGAPDPSTLHAGLPPTSGEKWVFSQWIRDRLPAA